MALLTKNEKNSFEEKLFKNVASKELNARICPGCKSHVIRKDLTNLCVRCPQCQADRRTIYDFCWQCLREWRGPGPRSDHCENPGCRDEALVTLRTCPKIEFKDVKGVTGCPSVRACPTCGVLVEHDRLRCKGVTCTECKTKFCFVCLKTFAECSSTSNIYNKCSSGVAPTQTSIPVKNK